MTTSRLATTGLILAMLGAAFPAQGHDAQPQEPSDASAATDAAAAINRSGENVVRQAEDGFGATIGRETIGIYSSTSVRGFSPTAAGNVRIDGLYYDQVYILNARLASSTSIRVGLSAQGFAFPAPTGVVDYRLRTPAGDPSLSATLAGNGYGAASLDLDFTVPLDGQKLVLGGGVSAMNNESASGTHGLQHIEGLALSWRPTPNIQLVPFWSRSDIFNSQLAPSFIPAGEALPPRIPLRRRLTPDWALYSGFAVLYGTLGTVDVAPGWRLRVGMFRSDTIAKQDMTWFFSNLRPDGQADLTVYADPPHKFASSSGEIRLTHSFTEGPRSHRIILSLRGRNRFRAFGGSAFLDFGQVTPYGSFDIPEPPLIHSERTDTYVRQIFYGAAYAAKWNDVGEISMSLSKTRYRKNVLQPGLPETQTRSSPLLYNISGAVYVSPRVAIYGSYAKGLEESGVAPQNASNRNDVLPAIETSQKEIGLRWTLTPSLSLITGAFDLRRPYFSLDQTGLYRQLGSIRNRGLELSLTGALTDRLNVVLGGNLLDPQVTGEAVKAGTVGKRPVGVPLRSASLNLDWRTPFLDALSLDTAINHQGRIPATPDNAVFIPNRTLIDIGGRYRFRISGKRATLRVAVTNLFNVYGFDLESPGTYTIHAGRLASAYLAVDF